MGNTSESSPIKNGLRTHFDVSGIRPEGADQPSPGQRPGVTGAKRKSPAFCNPLPTLLRLGGERIAERGAMGRPFDPGCRSARGGVALPWAGLICPSGAHRASPIYSWNPCPYHCPGTFTRANDYSSPPPPGTRGFAFRRGGTSTRYNHSTTQQFNNPTIQQPNMPPSGPTGRTGHHRSGL